MNFGENLKNLRTQRGLSQQELAELADFSQVAICRFENGKLIPRCRSVDALAKALNITADMLLYGEEKRSRYMNIPKCAERGGMTDEDYEQLANSGKLE